MKEEEEKVKEEEEEEEEVIFPCFSMIYLCFSACVKLRQ